MGKKRIQMQILSLVVCFCNLILGSTVFGAPVVQRVSDKITDGGTITIIGSGFGEHDDYDGTGPYLNYAFENCEAGVIDASKGWQGRAVMTTSNNRSGSSYNLFHEKDYSGTPFTTMIGETSTSEYRYGLKIYVNPPTNHAFFSQWVRLSDNFGVIGGSSQQVKILMSSPQGSSGNKDYFSSAGYSNPPELYTATESGMIAPKHGPIQSWMPYGTWHRMDMWVSAPSSSAGDHVRYWIDGKLVADLTQLGYEQTVVNPPGLISFIGYMSGGTGWGLQTDDHFIDYTMARVEISDSPVWDDSVQTHKEIQLPLTWTKSSIEVKANLGSFPTDKPLYLYVVDATGAVNSAGFLLGDETVPPTAEPTGSIPQTVKGFLAVQ